MQKFLQRRLYDSLSFLLLVALLGGFAILLHINPGKPSDSIHLILQARAWLQGHLDIGRHIHDSVIVNGKVYIIYPPLPALLMAPFVALLGDRFSDVWFTWAFAALNIVLLFRTLEVMRVRRITNRTVLENWIIALTFGFGTIALWLALGGKVWFTIKTLSVSGIIFTLHSTLSRRWSLATLGVGLVVLTRTSEALIGIVPLIVYLHDLGIGRRVAGRRYFLPQRWPALRELAGTLAPFVVALLLYLLHNQLYFGNFLSTGFDIQNQQLYPQIQYGVISWHYIWPNFVIDFLRWPNFSFLNPFDVHPHVDLIAGGIGTSIFFSTPLLAIFLFAPQGKTPQPWLRATFWATVAILLLTILAYCMAGWFQVGARYLFPLYPLLFVLLAQRAAPLDARWLSLASLSVFINLLLARAFWEGNSSKLFVAASAGVALLAGALAFFLLRSQRQPRAEEAPASSPLGAGDSEEVNAHADGLHPLSAGRRSNE